MRRQRRVRTPQSAFKGNIGGLYSAVSVLMSRLTEQDRLFLTDDEFVTMFVPAELRSVWIPVSQLAEKARKTTCRIAWELPPCTEGKLILDVEVCDFAGRLRQRPLLPEPHVYTVDENNPESMHIHKKISAWVDRRWHLGVEFGRVRFLLSELDRLLTTPAHVRYYWPPICTLGNVMPGNYWSGSFVALLSAEAKAPPPPLPLAVRELCRATAGIVTSASMLEPLEHQQEEQRADVEVKFADPTFFRRTHRENRNGGEILFGVL